MVWGPTESGAGIVDFFLTTSQEISYFSLPPLINILLCEIGQYFTEY